MASGSAMGRGVRALARLLCQSLARQCPWSERSGSRIAPLADSRVPAWSTEKPTRAGIRRVATAEADRQLHELSRYLRKSRRETGSRQIRSGGTRRMTGDRFVRHPCPLAAAIPALYSPRAPGRHARCTSQFGRIIAGYMDSPCVARPSLLLDPGSDCGRYIRPLVASVEAGP